MNGGLAAALDIHPRRRYTAHKRQSDKSAAAHIEFCSVLASLGVYTEFGIEPSTRISRAGSYLKPLLVQVANALIHSRKHPEFAERYRRIKARRGHKKAIIAVCKMLLTAIWNILSKLVPYSPAGFLSASHDLPPSMSLTVAQGLSLLRRRGFILTDDPLSAP